jgi:hypothetical protein
MSAETTKLRDDAARYVRLARAIIDHRVVETFLASANQLNEEADRIEAREANLTGSPNNAALG